MKTIVLQNLRKFLLPLKIKSLQVQNVKTLFLSCFILFSVISHNLDAQIGIGTDTPDASAILDLEADDKGLLMPRVDIADLNTSAPVAAPPAGLIVWNTNTATGEGFYYWDNDQARWTNLFGGDIGQTAWMLTGNENTDPDVNFLGTTDAEDLVFRTNDTQRMKLFSGGPVSVNFDGVFNLEGEPSVFNVGAAGSDHGIGAASLDGVAIWGWAQEDGDGILAIAEGDGDGIWSIAEGEGHGIYGNTLADGVSSSAGIFGRHTYETGTAIVGLGQGELSYYTFNNGSALAATGTTTGLGAFALQEGNAIQANNIETGTVGLIGATDFGVVGLSPNELDGALGGEDWAGYFWGHVYLETSDWGDFYTGHYGTLDDPIFTSTSASYSYIGSSDDPIGNIYANNITETSRRDKKTDIYMLNEKELASLMNDIENLELGFYYLKHDTNSGRSRDDSQPTPTLGTFTDASPDYIQDKTFSGISIYKYASLAMAGVKHLNNEVKKIKSEIKTVKDFGSTTVEAETEKKILFNSDFTSKTRNSEVPVINITPIGYNQDFTIISRDSGGFIIKAGNEPVTIDWVAYAKIETIEEVEHEIPFALSVSEAEKERLRALYQSKERDITRKERPEPANVIKHSVKERDIEKRIIKKEIEEIETEKTEEK